MESQDSPLGGTPQCEGGCRRHRGHGRGLLTHAASVSLPVEVYNCAMGSPDCSQCLGREDLGHLCVWTDSCRLRGPLQPLPGTCPAPEIRAVSTPTMEARRTHVPTCATHTAARTGPQTCGSCAPHDRACACSSTSPARAGGRAPSAPETQP